jgi:N-formylglutamate deformylase
MRITLEPKMILHIPHSSRMIPENLRDQIVLSDNDLSAELVRMTDAFTDELFFLPETTIVRFPISRLLVDVERFQDDAEEPMSKVGMGMIYTLTAYGNMLKRTLQPHETRNLVSQYYETHHQTLLAEAKNELENSGKALIVDCHSFPSQPLPCDKNQSIPRPEFCIGTDSFHTPRALIQVTARSIKKLSYSVGINRPYAGSMVPMAFYKKDSRVASIMIEVNRSLYIDELAGTKTSRFDPIKEQLQTLLSLIREFQQGAEPDARGQWRGVPANPRPRAG